MKSKFKGFMKNIFNTIQKPYMGILPGQLAFFFVVSIIPLLALLGSLAGPFNISANTIVEFLERTLPSTLVELFKPMIVGGKSLTVNVSIFYVSAFILASNGAHSMILSSNMIYKFKNKEYIYRRIKALFMTFILVFLLVFILLVPAFGDKIVEAIAALIHNDNVIEKITIIYSILKYPVSFIFIFINIKLLYTLAPDSELKSKYTTYGSIVTTILWILATEIYSLYVIKLSRYNLFYGSISNILILLIWMYILAYIFVLGMALNASYYDVEDN